MKDLRDLRHDNDADQINPDTFDANPIIQLQSWLDEAIESGYYQANAMSISTVSTSGKPSSRVVLLKELDEDGLIFYTNYHSRKGKELVLNPHACALFYWDKLERQIRIEGEIEMVDTKLSDDYFSSRPRDSQLGAACSPQSQPIAHRLELAAKYDQLAEQYQDQPIPRPDNWGGYRLKPEVIEFWQGRPSRLHDRLVFTQQAGTWLQSRLAP